jgi:hypothetical protein
MVTAFSPPIRRSVSSRFFNALILSAPLAMTLFLSSDRIHRRHDKRIPRQLVT